MNVSIFTLSASISRRSYRSDHRSGLPRRNMRPILLFCAHHHGLPSLLFLFSAGVSFSANESLFQSARTEIDGQGCMHVGEKCIDSSDSFWQKLRPQPSPSRREGRQRSSARSKRSMGEEREREREREVPLMISRLLMRSIPRTQIANRKSPLSRHAASRGCNYIVTRYLAKHTRRLH